MFNVNLGSQVESRGEFLQTLFAGALPLRAAAWGDGVKGMLHSLYARCTAQMCCLRVSHLTRTRLVTWQLWQACGPDTCKSR